jgi:hypothetical protein
MARRPGAPLNIARYCGNTETKEVHDLDSEQAPCQIDEIILAGHAVPFDDLEEARIAGYKKIHYCICSSDE